MRLRSKIASQFSPTIPTSPRPYTISRFSPKVSFLSLMRPLHTEFEPKAYSISLPKDSGSGGIEQPDP